MAQLRQSVAVSLVMALVLSVAAQCLAGQEMTTEQMACCAGTEHDCQSPAVGKDCCQSETTGQAQVVAQIQQIVQPLVLIAATLPAFAPPEERPTTIVVETTVVKGASPPKYVLLATFLI